jgi:hypothetical protein
MRIDLAVIEGKIYSFLYPGRSTKIQDFERQQRVATLQAMLDQWYSRIPSEFGIDAVYTAVSDTALVHMTNLHHAYLLCIKSTHGIYSSQADWMQRLGSLSRVAIHEFAVTIQGP